jgi:hypothetical protein
MSDGPKRPLPGPCARLFLAAFGTLFLIAVLAVPVTTKSSQVRQDPQSNIVIRTTYPRYTTMFLPGYLTAKARASEAEDIRLRSAQWFGTMGVVVFLGILDYFVCCRLLRRRRRAPGEI